MKKVISIILVIAMLLTLSGCISSSGIPLPDQKKNVESGEITDDDSDVQKKTVEVGVIIIEVNGACEETLSDSSKMYTFNNSADSPSIVVGSCEEQVKNTKEKLLPYGDRLLARANNGGITIIEMDLDEINGIAGYHTKYIIDVNVDIDSMSDPHIVRIFAR